MDRGEASRTNQASVRRAAWRNAWSRDRVAVLVGLVTLAGMIALLAGTDARTFLTPGPMSSAHGALEDCKSCHTKSGDGGLSWLHGLYAAVPRDDSKACLTCHVMPAATAFNPHGATTQSLKESTERLREFISKIEAPPLARAQDAAFPVRGIIAAGLDCASCHQEHQGRDAQLAKVTNEQCRSCHIVKFDSFDTTHPKFTNYPFKRRTRIIYDHAGHFSKHYPEVARKEPAKSIPETCASCHVSAPGSQVMALAPFEKTCAACHLDQITGKARAVGPKGVAFLSLPGIDLQTMKEKRAEVGEWPQESDAPLTPFMKFMIARSDRGQALVRVAERLDLQDLSGASDDQINAVKALTWEIKSLVHALISGKASDVLGEIRIGPAGAKLSPALLADLTASIPRDVLVSAQQRWLPNLPAEIAQGASSLGPRKEDWATEVVSPAPPPAASEPDRREPASEPEPETAAAGPERDQAGVADEQPAPADRTDDPLARNQQKCLARVLGQCLVYATDDPNAAGSALTGLPPPPAAADAREPPRPFAPAQRLGGPARPSVRDGARTAAGAASGTARTDDAIRLTQGPVASSPANARSGAASGRADDLLFPTDEEKRAIEAHRKAAGRSPQRDRGLSATATQSPAQSAPAGSARSAAPAVMAIESDVDPESWAEHGGWYKQDYAIFYRPAGHKDKLIATWLALTGSPPQESSASLQSDIFRFLTGKDAQGSCAKCHSIDDLAGGGRSINFSPLTPAHKMGRFTRFSHEPHLSVVGEKGCLTCHDLQQGRRYLDSYKEGDPRKVEAEFMSVKKETCTACHASARARQDCLLCHTYHVNGVITPITDTKLSRPEMR